MLAMSLQGKFRLLFVRYDVRCHLCIWKSGPLVWSKFFRIFFGLYAS